MGDGSMKEIIKYAFSKEYLPDSNEFPNVTVDFDETIDDYETYTAVLKSITPNTKMEFEIAKAIISEFKPNDKIRIVGYDYHENKRGYDTVDLHVVKL